MSDLVPVLVGFGRALRSAGLAVGTGDVAGYCAATATLDPADLVDLYWAGRTTLLSRRDDIPAYDEVFRAYFLDDANPVDELITLLARTEAGVVEVPADELPPDTEESDDDEAQLGLVASGVDVLRHKSFSACTPDELAALRRLMARLKLTPPRRRTRRTRPAHRSRRPDLRQTVRASLRRHGELVELRWRRRRVKLRPLVLILDVSGSMADHSRALLQFAYSARRASPAQRVHVYCFGTRLTCITAPLRHRTPDVALREAGQLVVDWEGGTRIGQSLEEFVRTAGRRGVCRGAVVVICSDGLDRGNPETLATAMERLARLSHRIVWCHPNARAGKAPRTMGMLVAEPHIDELVSGHDLSSLAELAALLPRLG